MSRSSRQFIGIAAVLSTCALSCRLTMAQEGAGAKPNNSSNPAFAKLTPPPLPPSQNPVAFFRELLVMDSGQRIQFLTNRPPESQKRILAKIKEYEALTPDQRELRLRVTELRFYLLPLMSALPNQRAAQLALVPEELQPLIADRLRSWDELSAAQQKEVLDNESLLGYLIDRGTNTPIQALTNVPAVQRQALEERIARWQQLTPDQQDAITNRFDKFFRLTPGEQRKTLQTLSQPEQQQIDKTLKTLQKLEPSRRLQCVRSFQKFASLSPAERAEFLKNAASWEMMSPAERKAWRALVYNISRMPPAPPGLRAPSLPPPPMPPLPGGARTLRSPAVATNQ